MIANLEVGPIHLGIAIASLSERLSRLRRVEGKHEMNK